MGMIFCTWAGFPVCTPTPAQRTKPQPPKLGQHAAQGRKKEANKRGDYRCFDVVHMPRRASRYVRTYFVAQGLAARSRRSAAPAMPAAPAPTKTALLKFVQGSMLLLVVAGSSHTPDQTAGQCPEEESDVKQACSFATVGADAFAANPLRWDEWRTPLLVTGASEVPAWSAPFQFLERLSKGELDDTTVSVGSGAGSSGSNRLSASGMTGSGCIAHGPSSRSA